MRVRRYCLGLLGGVLLPYRKLRIKETPEAFTLSMREPEVNFILIIPCCYFISRKAPSCEWFLYIVSFQKALLHFEINK